MPHSTAGRFPAIGLIGFGAFGKLIAHHLRPWFTLHVFDPACAAGTEAEHGVAIGEICAAARCPIVILAMPVDQLASAIAAINPHLSPGSIVLDVCSVKIEPARIMAAMLPRFVEIVGTHPLFGPQSASDGIAGRKIALCPIRGTSAWRIAAFLRKTLGVKVIITTPGEHDRETAVVQGLTHLIARLMVQMEPLPTRMSTASFDMLIGAVDMVRNDPQAVFHAIEKANPYASAARSRFFALADEMRHLLDG